MTENKKAYINLSKIMEVSMGKKRVHELAKELNKTNKDIINLLREKNINVTSHMSNLGEDEIKLVKDILQLETGEKKAAQSSSHDIFRKMMKKSNLAQVVNSENSSKTKEKREAKPSPNKGEGKKADRPKDFKKQGDFNPSFNKDNAKKFPRNEGENTWRPRENNNRLKSERPNQDRDGNKRNKPFQKDGQRQGGFNKDKKDFKPRNPRFEDRNSAPKKEFGDRPAGGQKSKSNEKWSSNIVETPLKKPGSDKKRNDKNRKDKEKWERTEDGFGKKGKGKGTSSNRLEKQIKNKPAQKQEKKSNTTIREVTIPEPITIRDLAALIDVKAADIIKKLFLEGKILTVNHEISYEMAEGIALEYNCIATPAQKVDVIEELLREEEEKEETMVKRPPVVCVMGHVDHGKTSLLDAIRNTRVTDREAGGITQHIGAYTVDVDGEAITFLDTPGHEAFTEMRMRGANSTDIAILVVAADDGVMPQTVEAINHAKAAGVEIIVAINKIDKPAADINRVQQELTEYELISSDWGGSTTFVPVSAKRGDGIEELLEMILLTAEVLELKANPDRKARGIIIEAKLDKGRGSVATVLVQKGTLKEGDSVSAGAAYGKVRAMLNDKGKRVKEALPSMPVEIIGLNVVPEAGDILISHEIDKEARTYAETFVANNKEKLIEDTKSRMNLQDIFSEIKSGNMKDLNLIVKADVQGSVEAVKQSLLRLSNEEVTVKIIHSGVGNITDSDVSLASASSAIIIGFNVKQDVVAKATAEREHIDVRMYRVIYDIIEDIERAMKGLLDPVFEEKILGHAQVRQVFKSSSIGNIAGSYVLDGVIQRGCMVRITRDNKEIFNGNLESLKRFQDDVKEVRSNYECGLVFEGFSDVKVDDMVEAYTMVEVSR